MILSILIANYNNGQFFQDCYNSVIAQTDNNWEVIIVDDCSSDDSVERISNIIKDDCRFKLFVNDTNKGCGYTKNRCATLATGEIAGYLDPDDTLMQNAIEVMREAHLKTGNISLVYSSLNFCDENLKVKSINNKAKAVDVNIKFINLNTPVNHFATFKMAFYKKTSGIDVFLLRAVDQDLYLKLSESGPFYFIDKPLYNYRIHDKGISTSKADHAFYWYLKVIMKAEERRKVNLENEVAELLNRTDPNNLQINLANPRYLILAMGRAFKKTPARFLKKLFVNK